eukprot:gene1309-582_t
MLPFGKGKGKGRFGGKFTKGWGGNASAPQARRRPGDEEVTLEKR